MITVGYTKELLPFVQGRGRPVLIYPILYSPLSPALKSSASFVVGEAEEGSLPPQY